MFPIGFRKELGGETCDDLVGNRYWPILKPIGKGTSESRSLIGWEEGKAAFSWAVAPWIEVRERLAL